jgi:CRISPR-associated protein Cas5t
MSAPALALFAAVPIAAFREPYAREYLTTLPCPPPATVYGMLLSLVGEMDRRVHQGAELAIALLSAPVRSKVIRTSWRIKTTKVGAGLGANKRPDYQELLTDVRLAVWVRSSEAEQAARPLVERVRAVVDREESPERFGGLALGESTHLVDEVRRLRAGDPDRGQLLVQDPAGDLALPVWVDHVGSAGTRWGQYRLVEADLGLTLPEVAWSRIEPPG